MKLIVFAGTALAVLVLPNVAFGVTLYSKDFEVDSTTSWTVNNNGLGTNVADFFYDYSALGIPSSPHSTGGTTRGLKLGANLNSATAPAAGIPGISVSPTGESFTGDYELKFDWWHNYFGPLNVSGTGSTMFSSFGILSSGTSPNYTGAVDSVMFAATGDGGAAADFRIYSPENPASYPAPDPSGHAFYPAGSRNATTPLYQSTFPGGIGAPSVQQTNYPSQTGTTVAGNTGFAWHDVSIKKVGTLVSWRVNGVLLGQVDTANFNVPTAGTNILFGDFDVNNTTNSSADYATLAFTLIDNVRVEQDVVTPPIVLDNGSLRVTVSANNGSINQVLFGGSDYYNPGTPVSNWGMQIDTDFNTFLTNITEANGFSTGIPVSVAAVGDTAVVTGSFAPGGGVDFGFTRTYSLVPGQNVLRITTEFVNNGVDATISYFDTFDPDQGFDQGNSFDTFNDVFSVLQGTATVGQATELSGLSVVMGSLNGAETVASGSPFAIGDGFTLNDFFSAPLDGNGQFVDSGTHVGIRRFLAAGGTFTFTYDQAYGHSATEALGEFISANVPEPATLLLLLMFAATGWCLRRARPSEKYHQVVDA